MTLTYIFHDCIYMQQSLLHLARVENLPNSQLEHLQQRDREWRILMGLIWEGGSKIKLFDSGEITWQLFLGCWTGHLNMLFVTLILSNHHIFVSSNVHIPDPRLSCIVNCRTIKLRCSKSVIILFAIPHQIWGGKLLIHFTLAFLFDSKSSWVAAWLCVILYPIHPAV